LATLTLTTLVRQVFKQLKREILEEVKFSQTENL